MWGSIKKSARSQIKGNRMRFGKIGVMRVAIMQNKKLRDAFIFFYQVKR